MEENKGSIRMNTVKRVDPHVTTIVDSASGTALYTYEDNTENWSRSDIVGTLMIYTREAPPHNVMTIINRNSKANFVEPITPNCEIQEKSPFLLFKNDKGSIYCIWFPETSDVQRISDAVNNKISEQSIPNIMSNPAIAAAQTGGGDILAMLSKAQDEFKDKSSAPFSTNELVRPFPVRAEVNVVNPVADFLAQVSNVNAANANSTTLKTFTQASQSSTNPVLDKLFQGATSQSRLPPSAAAQIPKGSAPIQIPIQSKMESVSNLGMSVEELEGKLKGSLSVSMQRNSINMNLMETQSSFTDTRSLLAPQTFVMPLANSLLTPMLETKTTGSSQESLPENFRYDASPVSALNQEQFLAAFLLLLKKDDFVKDLHQAYVKSLHRSPKDAV